jgi:hypothetical protein
MGSRGTSLEWWSRGGHGAESINATTKKGIISQIEYLGLQDPKGLDGILPALINKTMSLR